MSGTPAVGPDPVNPTNGLVVADAHGRIISDPKITGAADEEAKKLAWYKRAGKGIGPYEAGGGLLGWEAAKYFGHNNLIDKTAGAAAGATAAQALHRRTVGVPAEVAGAAVGRQVAKHVGLNDLTGQTGGTAAGWQAARWVRGKGLGEPGAIASVALGMEAAKHLGGKSVTGQVIGAGAGALAYDKAQRKFTPEAKSILPGKAGKYVDQANEYIHKKSVGLPEVAGATVGWEAAKHAGLNDIPGQIAGGTAGWQAAKLVRAGGVKDGLGMSGKLFGAAAGMEAGKEVAKLAHIKNKKAAELVGGGSGYLGARAIGRHFGAYQSKTEQAGKVATKTKDMVSERLSGTTLKEQGGRVFNWAKATERGGQAVERGGKVLDRVKGKLRSGDPAAELDPEAARYHPTFEEIRAHLPKPTIGERGGKLVSRVTGFRNSATGATEATLTAAGDAGKGLLKGAGRTVAGNAFDLTGATIGWQAAKHVGLNDLPGQVAGGTAGLQAARVARGKGFGRPGQIAAGAAGWEAAKHIPGMNNTLGKATGAGVGVAAYGAATKKLGLPRAKTLTGRVSNAGTKAKGLASDHLGGLKTRFGGSGTVHGPGGESVAPEHDFGPRPKLPKVDLTPIEGADPATSGNWGGRSVIFEHTSGPHDGDLEGFRVPKDASELASHNGSGDEHVVRSRGPSVGELPKPPSPPKPNLWHPNGGAASVADEAATTAAERGGLRAGIGAVAKVGASRGASALGTTARIGLGAEAGLATFIATEMAGDSEQGKSAKLPNAEIVYYPNGKKRIITYKSEVNSSDTAGYKVDYRFKNGDVAYTSPDGKTDVVVKNANSPYHSIGQTKDGKLLYKDSTGIVSSLDPKTGKTTYVSAPPHSGPLGWVSKYTTGAKDPAHAKPKVAVPHIAAPQKYNPSPAHGGIKSVTHPYQGMTVTTFGDGTRVEQALGHGPYRVNKATPQYADKSNPLFPVGYTPPKVTASTGHQSIGRGGADVPHHTSTATTALHDKPKGYPHFVPQGTQKPTGSFGTASNPFSPAASPHFVPSPAHPTLQTAHSAPKTPHFVASSQPSPIYHPPTNSYGAITSPIHDPIASLQPRPVVKLQPAASKHPIATTPAHHTTSPLQHTAAYQTTHSTASHPATVKHTIAAPAHKPQSVVITHPAAKPAPHPVASPLHPVVHTPAPAHAAPKPVSHSVVVTHPAAKPAAHAGVVTFGPKGPEAAPKHVTSSGAGAITSVKPKSGYSAGAHNNLH